MGGETVVYVSMGKEAVRVQISRMHYICAIGLKLDELHGSDLLSLYLSLVALVHNILGGSCVCL